MNISLKNCRNLRVLDFIKSGKKSFSELRDIVKAVPNENDRRYLAAIGLTYLMVVITTDESKMEHLSALKYFVSLTNEGNGEKKLSSWYFDPSEFGETKKKTNVLEYAFLYCSFIPKIKLLIKESNNLNEFKRVMVRAPKSRETFHRIMQMLRAFTNDDDDNDDGFKMNVLFSIDDSFNISEPNLFLHYFLDNPEIINILINDYKADIETVNAIGFDFITYGIFKNEINVVREQIEKRYYGKNNEKYNDLNDLVDGYSFLCNPNSIDAKEILKFKRPSSHPEEWVIFQMMEKIILKYYNSYHHPIFLHILQKLQKSTYGLKEREGNFIRASLIAPLSRYLKTSRSIRYEAILLLKTIIKHNIKDNKFIIYKDLMDLLDGIEKLELSVDTDIIKARVNGNFSVNKNKNFSSGPNCGKAS